MSAIWISIWAMHANAGNPANSDPLVTWFHALLLLIVVGMFIYVIWESTK